MEEKVKMSPAIDPSSWKNRPMNDFSPLHRICSYLAMFPPNLANYFIHRFSREGDTVFDPFAGRGTTPLEAVLQDRKALGSDLNPLAVWLTRGKVTAPRGEGGMKKVLKRLEELEEEYKLEEDSYKEEAKTIKDEGPRGSGVGVVYSIGTLQTLLFLRKRLVVQDLNEVTDIDCFIVAIILGAMHGQTDSYFSVSMPNTFSMSPSYIEKYVEQHDLNYPDYNIFNIIRERSAVALRLLNEKKPNATIKRADATKVAEAFDGKEVSLVFSSPPYLKVIKYGLYNWIRLWFLKIPHKEIDEVLSDDLNLPEYIEFMKSTMESIEQIIHKDGLVCWVIGDVKKKGNTTNLAQKVWDEAIDHSKWELHISASAPAGIVVDEIAPSKKVTRIWNSSGHEIWHESLDMEGGNYIEIVDSQSMAEERIKELGDGYFSIPVGTSGQATPVDRILMIKPIGAKIYDRELSKTKSTKSDPNNFFNLHVTTPYLEWVVNLSEKDQTRYLRRMNKMEITRVVLNKIGSNLKPEDRSNGSTIKRTILLEIWQHTEKAVKLSNSELPKTKHGLLSGIHKNLDIPFDPETDTSSSSTVTKLGILKILIGLTKMDY